VSRDYGGFRALADAAADEHTFETSCPICGTPVELNTRGLANCPLGHWSGRLSPEGYTTGPNRV
jgi:hypothetical protein